MAHIILGLALPEHLNVAAQADRTAREAGFTDAAHMNACFRPATDQVAQEAGFADAAALNTHFENRNAGR
jgi:transcriptional regulator GlxA family with amidase domain